MATNPADGQSTTSSIQKTLQLQASKSWAEHVAKEFNSEVKRAVDGAIYGIVGQDVLRTFHAVLKEQYNINPNEIPFHPVTVFDTLEHTFGAKGARTISRAIAKRLCYRLNLQFAEMDNYRLQDYLEQAKKELRLPSHQVSRADER